MRKDQSLTRSARAPDTIEAVVATKVIWKNQLDISEYPLPMTAAALSASPPRKAISSADASNSGVIDPIQPLTSTYIRL